MNKTSEIQRQKAAVLKAYRTAIRLKHSLAADDEIARTLPDVEDKINSALALGNVVELNPGEVFREV